MLEILGPVDSGAVIVAIRRILANHLTRRLVPLGDAAVVAKQADELRLRAGVRDDPAPLLSAAAGRRAPLLGAAATAT